MYIATCEVREETRLCVCAQQDFNFIHAIGMIGILKFWGFTSCKLCNFFNAQRRMHHLCLVGAQIKCISMLIKGMHLVIVY